MSKRRAARKAKAAAASAPRQRDGVRPIHTLAQLMAQALAMETEAAQRYAEFADAMEVHNNPEVAALFRRMAEIEDKHAQRIMAEMGWKEPPAAPGKPAWKGFEAPETASHNDVHYLMEPYHVLEIAHLNEQRAMLFFSRLARAATDNRVRSAARELHSEEAEHVALVEAWMKKLPRPEKNRADDPDPATYTD